MFLAFGFILAGQLVAGLSTIVLYSEEGLW